MITVHPQYVVDAVQTRTTILLPADEREQILEALEWTTLDLLHKL